MYMQIFKMTLGARLFDAQASAFQRVGEFFANKKVATLAAVLCTILGVVFIAGVTAIKQENDITRLCKIMEGVASYGASNGR